jgi:hypothetical protein
MYSLELLLTLQGQQIPVLPICLMGAKGRCARPLITPSPAVGDNFGRSVAGVGTNALVGALFDDPGGVVDAGAGLFISYEL